MKTWVKVKMMRRFVMGVMMGVLITSSNASPWLAIPGLSQPTISPLALTDKPLANTGLSVNEDDVLSDQDANKLTLTDAQWHEARVWGLSEEEEKRYVQLMQNRSRIYYEGLRQTPLDILGIHARSETERTQLAARAARQEAQKVSKNIAWNNAFYVAYNNVFKGIPVVGDFDKSPYAPSNYKPMTLQANDALYLFITPEEAIKTVLMTVTDALSITPTARLHVMVLNADDTAIQLWANQYQIPREWVSSGRISLNHGELHFNALLLDKKTTPLLLLTRDGASRVVDLGRF